MKFFSLIFKQKRITVFILLFFIISGITLPQFSLAAWWEYLIPGWSQYKILKNISGLLGDTTAEYFYNAIIAGVGSILIVVTGALASMGSGFLSMVTKPDFMSFSYTGISGSNSNPVVAAGWPMIRDLANMFIVLGFIVIGISTTLRIQEYQAKKLLPKLIIIALLVNFSLLICGIFIDASNITMAYFLKSGGYMRHNFMNAIQLQTDSLWDSWKAGETIELLNKSVGLSFYNFLVFIIFMLFFFIFLFRYVALWILVILSPLAFVFYVFPFTRRFFEMWWSQFFSWCIIGIPAGFFLWLADKLTESLLPVGASNSSLLIYLTPSALLIAGFLFSLQTSAIGSGMTIRAFKKTGKFAGSGSAKLAGLAGGRLKDSKAGQWAGSKTGGALERIGLRAQGTTENNKKKSLEESSKRLEKGFDNNPEGNQKLAEISTQRAFSSKAMRDKAAATEILAKRNALNYIPEDKREAAAAHATAFGVSKESITKSHPNLATGIDDRQARQKLTTQEMAKLEGMMTPAQAKKAIKNYNPTADEIKGAKKDLIQEKIRERAIGYQPVSDAEVSQKLISNETEKLKGFGMTDVQIKDALKNYNPGTAETLKTRESLVQERMTKSIRKLSPQKSAELPIEAVDAQTLSSFDDKQFAGIGKKADPALIDHIKKFMKKPGGLAGQSEEYKAYRTRALGFAKGSAERKRMSDIQDYLSKDSNFIK